ncbi:SAM-dependent methyltransferase, partial [Frankia canadensis]|uniref:SAM-dependent methyltransferase n=1 Tax=Frankia canadensis TaxID=1836972 RepID=UPI00311A9CCF
GVGPIDVQPHPARMYDYYLGGKDNLAADREAAELLVDAYPATRVAIRELRGFLTRATAHLAGEAGVRQFVDIGVGLPAAPNLHEVAQASQPTARVVYVDNDPIVPA